MMGPYQTGFTNRCLIRKGSDYSTMSVPEAKSLWIQIGRTLGVMDWRVEYMLRNVPHDKRAID